MDKKDSLRLENQLCFPLYACAREVVKAYRPHLDVLGLTYTQYITMMVLWEEGKVSVRDLGRKLHLDSGTLTPLLKKLESKGYLKRERSTVDERVVIACITEEGRKLKRAAAKVPQAMSKEITDFPMEDAQELYRLLYKLIGLLEVCNSQQDAKNQNACIAAESLDSAVFLCKKIVCHRFLSLRKGSLFATIYTVTTINNHKM